jgi:hypothetical protein
MTWRVHPQQIYTWATSVLYNRWELVGHSGFTVKRLTNNRQYYVICISKMLLHVKLIYLLLLTKLLPASIFDLHILHTEVALNQLFGQRRLDFCLQVFAVVFTLLVINDPSVRQAEVKFKIYFQVLANAVRPETNVLNWCRIPAVCWPIASRCVPGPLQHTRMQLFTVNRSVSVF